MKKQVSGVIQKPISVILASLLLLTGLVAFAPLSGLAGTPSGNTLIVNGDFANGTEYGSTNTALMDATSAAALAAPYHSWFRAAITTGAIANDSDSHGKYLHTKQNVVQGVSLETGKTYTLTFDFRGVLGGATDKAEIYLASATSRGTPLSVSNVIIDGASDTTTNRMRFPKATTWYTHTITFQVTSAAPVGVPFAVLISDSDYNETTFNNTFDLDNVSLYEGTVSPKSDLVYDGGFEFTKNTYTAYSAVGTPLMVVKQQDGVTLPNTIWHQGFGNEAQYSRVTAEAVHTGSSAAIVNSYLHQCVSVAAGGVYELKFWAKSRNYNSLSFRFVSSNSRATAINTEGTRTASVTGSWTLYNYSITMPSSYSGSPLLSFFTNLSSGGNYTNYGTNDVYLDDVSLKPQYAMSASAEAGGAASVSKAAVAEDDPVTFTAIPDSGNTFLGWYKDGGSVAVSTDLSYTVEVSGNLSLTAKFQRPAFGGEGNLVSDGDFTNTVSVSQAEDYSTVTYSSAHIWYQPQGGSAIVNDNGNPCAKLNQWVYQSALIGANKIYSITYKAKTTDTGAVLNIVLRALKNRGVTLKYVDVSPLTCDGQWHTYTSIVQLSNLDPSYSDYVLGIGQTGGTNVYLDDVIMKEFDNTANVGYVGAAIRTSLVAPNYTQGLRFKTSISHDVIDSELAYGYHIAEYGHIAIKTAYLNNQPLVMDGVYNYNGSNKTVKKGAAYNADNGTNVIFADDGTTRQITAVLTGISKENYAENYTVRPYVIYRNGAGKTLVCYGQQQTAAIYNIAKKAYAAPGSGAGGFYESRETRLTIFVILQYCNPSVYTEFIENIGNLPANQVPGTSEGD